MTRHFNHTVGMFFASAFFAALFSMPFIASAETLASCNQVPTAKKQIEKTIESTLQVYGTDTDERTASFMQKNKEQSAAVLRSRREIDVAWRAYVRDITKKATTSEAKHAVELFTARVEKAKEAQYKADDAASAEFADGVTALVAERKAETIALSSEFKKDVREALADAVSRCGKGETMDTISGQIKTKLKERQKVYVNKAQNRSVLDEKLGALQRAREEKRMASLKAFKAELGGAFTNLQSVLH